MPSDQSDVFIRSEADAWFARNRAAIERFDPETDLVLRLVQLYDLQPRRVVEIGASAGVRLAALADRTAAKPIAVEPSFEAVAYGAARFPSVRYVRGRAEAVGLGSVFDLVIVYAVFHWIDRARLLRVVAEVDRLVADGGHLVIGDFHPPNRTMVPYHHVPGGEVHTFKQDYAALFAASGLYHVVASLEADYATVRLQGNVAGDDRIYASLLRKSLTDEYVKGTGKT